MANSENLQALIARAKGLMLKPSAEWEKIDLEKATNQTLFRDYLAPLAAIPDLALFLRMLVSGRFNPFGALFGSIVSYALSLLGVFLIGEVVYQLADNFSARQDRLKAMKAVVYSSTPIWLAGVFLLIPNFDFFFMAFSLYSLFLMYRGLSIVMKAPDDKLTAYEATVVSVSIVVFIILITVSAMISRPGA